MSVADKSGIQVYVGRQTIDREAAERTRDMTLVRLRAANVPWRQIGVILGLSHMGARKRWHAIPEEVREHYSRLTVG